MIHTESLPDSIQDDGGCEPIEAQVRDALAHLQDPDYQPSEALCELVGCAPEDGALAVQTAMMRAIERLRPQDDTPKNAFAQRVYDLLHNRFVLKLTLEETAQEMHLGVTSVWRIQRAAAHALTRALWAQREERQPTTPEAPAAEPEPPEAAPSAQAEDWRAQTQRELASLQASSPGAVTEVAETIEGVLKLMDPLASERGVRLGAKFVQRGLVAAVHPTALRQMLIAAIRRLTAQAPAGDVGVYAALVDGNVRITLSGPALGEPQPTGAELTDGIVVPEGLSVAAMLDGAQTYLWIEAPSIGKVTVLVVDDNPDMVRFYRSSTMGTRYHIVDANLNEDLLATALRVAPDIIVLDVMLPEIDGWELLMRLHEDPSTRPIPVIVSSVVREESLARTLGASGYLAKPVSRRDFIQALDEALLPASATAPTSPANSAAAG
ncbi:MAG: response regulator [Anaerolineales bacterium]|nr:response regulator [Anaerolineales bacterium]